MDKKAVESLAGHTAALSLTLTAVIQSLPPGSAHLAAQHLQAALHTAQKHDAEDKTSPGSISARDAIAGAYQELLETIARHSR